MKLIELISINMQSEHTFLHMFLIIGSVWTLIFHEHQSMILSHQNLFYKYIIPHKIHINILFLIYNILLYWYLNQLSDFVPGNFLKRDYQFQNLSWFLSVLLGVLSKNQSMSFTTLFKLHIFFFTWFKCFFSSVFGGCL